MKKLLLLSGKGGTGKTTTASAFIRFSEARAFADCDVDAPNLHLLNEAKGILKESDFVGGEKAFIQEDLCTGCGLCMENCHFDAIMDCGDHYAVDELRCEGCGVCQYVCPCHAVTLQQDLAGKQRLYEGDSVFSTAKLRMGRGNSGKLVTNVKLSLLKNAPDCELAIFDGSPGIGCPVIASVSGMDLVLMVAEPSQSGISDLQRLIKTAGTLQAKLAVCVNKWDLSPEITSRIESFCADQEIPFLGKIPYDPMVLSGLNQGRSIADFACPARDALYQIYVKTSKLLGI